MAEEADLVTVDDHTAIEDDDLEHLDDAGGVLYSHSDQATVGERLSHIESLVTQQLKATRKFYAENNYDPNSGKSIQFRRYGLNAGQVVSVIKEKIIRGDTVITCYTAGATVYFGTHPGIGLAAPDTVAIVGAAEGAARTMKTTQAIWAVASADCVIDIQEEFG